MTKIDKRAERLADCKFAWPEQMPVEERRAALRQAVRNLEKAGKIIQGIDGRWRGTAFAMPAARYRKSTPRS